VEVNGLASLGANNKNVRSCGHSNLDCVGGQLECCRDDTDSTRSAWLQSCARCHKASRFENKAINWSRGGGCSRGKKYLRNLIEAHTTMQGPQNKKKGVAIMACGHAGDTHTQRKRKHAAVEGHHVHSTLRKRVVDRDANFVKSPSSEKPEGHTQLPTNSVGRYHSGPLTAAGAAGTSREAQPPPTTALPLMQPPCVPSHTRHSMADGSTGAGNTRSRDGSA
jgi:hypothetical protein